MAILTSSNVAQYTDPITGKFIPGNPGGKGRSQISILGLIRQELAKVEPKSQKTYGELVTQRYIYQALKGDSKILRDLIDRTDGKALQHIITTTTTLNEILDQVEGKVSENVITTIQEKIDQNNNEANQTTRGTKRLSQAAKSKRTV